MLLYYYEDQIEIKNMKKDHEARVLHNKTLVSSIKSSIKDYIKASNKKSDELTQKVLDKIEEMPSIWTQTESELKRTSFLLRGLICRVVKDGGKQRRLLKSLEELKFYLG